MTNIKDRVIEVANFKGIRLEKFFSELGVTYATFKGKNKDTSLKSSIIERIHRLYPDVSLIWLITGEGNMIAPESRQNTILGDNNQVVHNSGSISACSEAISAQLRHKDEIISELRQRIEDLKAELDKKDAIIHRLLP